MKVYIACPYTLGNKEENVYRSKDVANLLMLEGLYPFNPLLAHYHDMDFPKDYDYWLEYCMVWLSCCDVVLRLSGESKGADKEVELAKDLKIPVFYDVVDLLLWALTLNNV